MTVVLDLARGRVVTATPGVSLQGGLLAFEDNAQTLHLAGAPDLSFAGDCCIEWCGRVSAVPAAGHLFAGYSLSGTGVVSAYGFTFNPYLSRLYAFLSGEIAGDTLQYDFSLVGSGIHHVAIDRAGTVVRLFVDGQLVDFASNTGSVASVVGPAGGTVDIGRMVYGVPGYTGGLSWCRLTNASRYSASFVPAPPVTLGDPLWADTVLLIVAGNTAQTGLDTLAAEPRRGDIKTFFFDLTTSADYALDGLLLATDDGLTTAVVLSLFTDARAQADDPIPKGDTDRRGWWGDAWPMVPGESMGSRLWLAWPGKQTADNLARAQEAAEDALRWLVDDGIARAVSVQASNPRDGVLALAVSIEKPEGEALSLRFESLWS